VKKLPLILLLVALIGFLLGMLHLFKLRFEAGDSFPQYSSFRADPIGTKALYESLDALISTRRNLRPLSKLGDGRDTTLLWLGADPYDLRLMPEDFRDLETFARSGGRLVVATEAVFVRPRTNVFAMAAARKGPPLGGGPTNLPPNLPDEFRKIDIRQQWKLSFDFADLAKNEKGSYDPASATLLDSAAAPALPETLDIHTTLCFTGLGPEWRVVYARKQGTNVHPVLIERTMGRGSIVLFADSFHFSNEALREDRQSGLLSWLVGAERSVVFDETHLGTSEQPGVATLARKYRLQPLFGALLLLALLFLWKNASRFMPPYEEQLAREQGDVVEGRDSASAFVNLLRRNIAPAGLLRVCLEQWNAALAGLRKPSRAKLEAMQRLIDAQNALEPSQRNPVGTYREFCRILSKSSGFRVPGSELFSSNAPSANQSSNTHERKD
jgi:hypothetical protein